MSERPPVFTPYALPAARELCASTGKLLVVDVMAQWCPPCKEMDRTTWRDPELVEWIRNHAIAVQVDADESPCAISVTAFPTVVAFRGGSELSRSVGFRTAPDLLDWLEFLRTGESTVSRLRRTVALEKDMKGRLKLARALLLDRLLDEGTAECEWLWENMARVDPSMKEARTAELARYVEWLVSAHPPARERFTAARDAAGTAADAAPADHAARADWVTLNDALGDVRRTVEWFHRVKGDETFAALLFACADRLVPLLLERGWWDEILAIYRDPMVELTRSWGCVEKPDANAAAETRPGELREVGLAHFRQHAGVLYGALVAARRTAAAEALKAEALRLDGSDEMRASLTRAGNRAKWS